MVPVASMPGHTTWRTDISPGSSRICLSAWVNILPAAQRQMSEPPSPRIQRSKTCPFRNSKVTSSADTFVAAISNSYPVPVTGRSGMSRNVTMIGPEGVSTASVATGAFPVGVSSPDWSIAPSGSGPSCTVASEMQLHLDASADVTMAGNQSTARLDAIAPRLVIDGFMGLV